MNRLSTAADIGRTGSYADSIAVYMVGLAERPMVRGLPVTTR